MTEDEIREKFGDETLRRVPVVNHPYKDPDALVDLGTTKNGGRIRINRAVVEADFKMGIGSIVPHHIPGFAGGAKIIQPGVSGEETTAYTHLLSVRAPRSYLGVLENPVREELDAMARKVGMNTILNTVLNRHGQVVQAFFGDVAEAFRAGVAQIPGGLRRSDPGGGRYRAVELPSLRPRVLAGPQDALSFGSGGQGGGDRDRGDPLP